MELVKEYNFINSRTRLISGSDFFCNEYYLDAYPDVKEANTNPLIHYITYGREERRLTRVMMVNEEECIQKSDISYEDNSTAKVDEKSIAVVCHLFNLDLADEFICYFGNIPIPYDLYISTTKGNEDLVKEIFNTNDNQGNLHVFSFENKGRDIGPFIEIFKRFLYKYDLVYGNTIMAPEVYLS